MSKPILGKARHRWLLTSSPENGITWVKKRSSKSN